MSSENRTKSENKSKNEIEIETVERMAKMARLNLSGSQLHEYTQQMSTVLKYFEEISLVDTRGIEPMVTPSEIESFWREDVAKNEYSAEEMVANAPLRSGSLFKVPQVV